MLGLSDEQFRILFSLLLSILFSIPIRYLPHRLKYIYSFIIGTALQIYVYRYDSIIIYVQSIIVYGLLKWNRKCGTIVTVYAIFYLSFYQIFQMIKYYGQWVLDASSLLMVITCKYSLLAYAYQDGSKTDDKLTDSQKKFAIKQLPTFWQYINYLHFLPTATLGPVIQYKDFDNYMKGIKPYDKISNPTIAILKTFIYSIICAAIYFSGQFYFPASYVKTQEFYNMNIGYIMIYIFLCITALKFKYYFGWKVGMCGVHASGLSFDGQGFNHIKACNPYTVETSVHIRDKINNWNMSVQQWLNKSIYQRSPFKSKMHSQLYVFMVSAIWHGFYIGYFFSFFLWFLQVYLQGLIFKSMKDSNSFIKKCYKATGIVGKLLLKLFVGMLFTINGIFFIVLEWKTCFRLIQRIYFIPQLVLLIGIIIFSLPWMKQKKHHNIPKELSDKEKQLKKLN